MFFLVPTSFAQLQITEVMYNPSSEMGSDSDLEWVEVFNNGTGAINLSGFTLNGKDFYGVTIDAGGYLVIAKELVDGSDKDTVSFEACYGNGDRVWNISDGNIKVTDSKAFSLSNTAGEVILENGSIVIIASYVDDYGGDGNGHSLEFVDGIWLDSKQLYGTPGKKNTADPSYVPPPERDAELSVYLKEPVYSNNHYNGLFKVRFLNKDNCSHRDAVDIHYSIVDENNIEIKEDTVTREKIGCSTYSSTGNILFSGGGSYSVCGSIKSSTIEDVNPSNDAACKTINVIDTSTIQCDVALEIISNESFIYEKGESIKYKINLNEKSYPFKINYWIEDIFGNPVKSMVTTTNTNQKSWKTNIEEEDRVLFLRAIVAPLCNDSNKDDNSGEKMFIVTNTEVISSSAGEGGAASTIAIKKVTPTDKKFGGLLKAEVEIYRGDTGKYSLSAFVKKEGKKISEVTKINLKEKFTEYKVTLPIQLDPNCNLKVEEGTATLVVEGLGEKDEDKISIQGVDKTLCRDYLSYVRELEKKESTGKVGGESSGGEGGGGKLSYRIVDLPEKVVAGKDFNVKLLFAGDSSEHQFKAWGYIYRGSKCYSCCSDCEIVLERDDNMVEFELGSGENKEVELLMQLDEEMGEGDYKLKVKINKDGQKTDKELTEGVHVVVEEKEEGVSQQANGSVVTYGGKGSDEGSSFSPEKREVNWEREGYVVYEGSSEKARKMIPVFLAITFGLLCLVLLWRK